MAPLWHSIYLEIRMISGLLKSLCNRIAWSTRYRKQPGFWSMLSHLSTLGGSIPTARTNAYQFKLVVEPTHLKNIQANWIISPRGQNKKCLSCHHPEFYRGQYWQNILGTTVPCQLPKTFPFQSLTTCCRDLKQNPQGNRIPMYIDN